MPTKVQTIVRGTKRLSGTALVVKGRNHVRMISGNPAYPELQALMPPLAAECDMLDAVSVRYEFNKGRIDLATRNASILRMRLLIDQLAGTVTTYAHDSVAYILGTGFDVKGKRSPSQPMAAPANLRAKPTAYPGRIDLRWGGVRNKIIYIIEHAISDPNNPDSWQRLHATSSNYCSAINLQSDVVYSFRLRAVGVLGAGPLSDVATAKPV
ncbi:MAG: fibronectin type III domain-containing protein [Flavobacteriales bacterium]